MQAPPKPESDDHVVRLINDKWVQKENHIGKMAFNTADQSEKEITELGPVPEGHTLIEPEYSYEKWDGKQWVADAADKYIHDYDEVDTTRRNLYSQMCDPLVAEANIKRLQGSEAEAKILENQAIAVRQEIRNEHPWPQLPTS